MEWPPPETSLDVLHLKREMRCKLLIGNKNASTNTAKPANDPATIRVFAWPLYKATAIDPPSNNKQLDFTCRSGPIMWLRIWIDARIEPQSCPFALIQ